jgi:glycosyltransferase involved in cell wall biosynthesis
MSFFSIIVPSHNRASLLREALRSVQRQTFTDFQCWVIDDASTDETPAVIREFLSDQRFQSIRNTTNRRQHYCRNRAIEKSTAPWITFLDSDDIWLPRRLQVFHEAIQRSPDIGFWFSNGYWFENDRIVGRSFDDRMTLPEGKVTSYFAADVTSPPYVTTNVAVRHECFERFGLFREDMQILEDFEFYARILAGGTPMGGIRECLSLYRLHPAQITRNYILQFDESIMALKAANPPKTVYDQRRRNLIRKTAGYLLKGYQPRQLRLFLTEQHAWRGNLDIWMASYLPECILRRLKAIYKTIKDRQVRSTLPGIEEAESYLHQIQQ